MSRFRLQQGTAEEAVSLVDAALRLCQQGARSLGQVLHSVSDPQQPFHDRDMYVFALSSEGEYLAFGGNPQKVGIRVQDVPGIRGEQLIADIIAQARNLPRLGRLRLRQPQHAEGADQDVLCLQAPGRVLGLRRTSKSLATV